MPEIKKPRRTRVDSAVSVSAAIAAAGRTIAPPRDLLLDELEHTIFTEIVEDMPKVDLTEHQIRLCAMLAQEMRQADLAHCALDSEGSVITNARGNVVVNPRARILNQHIASILSYRRSLGLTARALAGGDSRRVAVRRAHNLANEALLDNVDDDLLARPPAIPDNKRRH